MIRIVGKSDHEDENVAAENLRRAFVQWRPEIEVNGDSVLILVSVQAPGHRGQQDIDLVVLTRFVRPLEVQWQPPEGAVRMVPVWSFCASFEVKGHSLYASDGSQQIRFHDNKVDVRYGSEWHPASSQAGGQGKAFKARLRRESGISIWVVSFVWLLRVNAAQLLGRLNEPNSILPAAFNIERLGRKVLDLDNPREDGEGKLRYAVWVRDLDFDAVGTHLTSSYAISPLNRATIDKLIRRRIEIRHPERLGKQQQLITGSAGSGKTMVLLRTALEFYNGGRRVSVLTYNRTLVADINRLLMFMRVKGPSFAPNINIVTLHSYFIAVIKAVFPEETVIDATWLNLTYPKRLNDVIEYLRTGAATRDDIREKLIAQDYAFFDIACIDEGQDWRDEERDVLHLTIGSENCVIAAGFDQLVRQGTLCDWTKAGAVDTGLTPLRTCLRMKSGLATFANVVAEKLNLPTWHVEPDAEVVGGSVILVLGDYASYPDLHRQLLASNERDGNKNIDMLFCVEPGNVELLASGVRTAKLASELRALGHVVWDATTNHDRDDPPRSVNDCRIVQYESCRGLEGWIVVAEHLDEFFRKKVLSSIPSMNAEPSFLDDDDEGNARAFGAMWCMIPLTRAIDSLVITVSDEHSELGRVLLAAATALPETVKVYRNASSEAVPANRGRRR